MNLIVLHEVILEITHNPPLAIKIERFESVIRVKRFILALSHLFNFPPRDMRFRVDEDSTLYSIGTHRYSWLGQIGVHEYSFIYVSSDWWTREGRFLRFRRAYPRLQRH